MAADLLLPTPFGLSALVGCLVGFAVGSSTGAITREVWWFPAVVALAASAVAVMLYAVLGAVLGQDQFLDVNLVAVVGVVAVTNALLAAPAVRVVAWALGPSSADGARSPAGGRW
jgi:cell shape-determining protein MreD